MAHSPPRVACIRFVGHYCCHSSQGFLSGESLLTSRKSDMRIVSKQASKQVREKEQKKLHVQKHVVQIVIKEHHRM